MIIAFMVPIAIGMLLVIAVSYINITADKKNEISNHNALMVSNILERIDKFTSAVEIHAQNNAVVSLNPELAEPYLKDFMEKEGEVWSHFLITDGTGVNVAHTDGESARGVSIADRSYFTVPWNQGITEIAQPTISKSTGRKILAIGVPIFENGQKIGVLVGFVRLEYISQILNDFELTNGSFSFMLNKNGVVSAHPNDDIVLTQNWMEPAEDDTASQAYFASMSQDFKSIVGKMIAGETNIENAEVDGKLSLVCYQPLGVANLFTATVSPITEVYSVFIAMLLSLLLASVVTIVLNVFTSAKMADGITKPIVGVTNWAKKLAMGDNSGQKSMFVDMAKIREAEIIMLVNSFESMAEGVRNNVDVVQTIANGNLNVTAPSRSADDVLSIALNKLTHQVSHTLSQVSRAVSSVSEGSAHVANSANNLASGATEQALSIDKLSVAIEHMQEQIKHTVDNIAKITDDTNAAERELNATNNQMLALREEIRIANEQAEEIIKINKTIADIAFQINLLALNASVEAAHAGSAGQGFAVVADEVRSLAGKTTESAKSTSLLIENTVSSILNIAKNAETTVGAMDSINTMTKEVALDVREIAKTIEEELVYMNEIVESVDQISVVMQTNTATSEESAAASQELSNQAVLMQELIEQFKLKDTHQMNDEM